MLMMPMDNPSMISVLFNTFLFIFIPPLDLLYVSYINEMIFAYMYNTNSKWVIEKNICTYAKQEKTSQCEALYLNLFVKMLLYVFYKFWQKEDPSNHISNSKFDKKIDNPSKNWKN